MRLEKIKLSGFKSFVDPTTIAFPSNLMGVVGPNGCGKSNIIDAVRWVMGESSAKYLRGEAIADVIFNGSTQRKPLGKASIEMTFDNSSGKIGGQYANYSQISVRREVERDGQSDYYLNGTRCRRRDITDVFLGTGLSPRSYAIIEQGMINRIIESKPQDLRSNFEEVAGIAKYKERRRETENRIKHSKENLARITDLYDELSKQIDRLKRQSRAAERYQVLKGEERQLKGQLLATRWQDLNENIEKGDQLLNEGEVLLQSKVTEQQNIETELVKQREQQHDKAQGLSDAQEQVYQVSTEITRLEQRIQHDQSRRQSLHNDAEQTVSALTEVRQHIDHDESQVEALQHELGQLTPALEQARAEYDQARGQLQAAEQALTSWQQHWDSFNEQSARMSKTVEIEKTRIQHLEQQQQSTAERLQQLVSEQQTVDYQQLEAEHQLLAEQTQSSEQAVQASETQLQQLQLQRQQQQQQQQHQQATLETQRESLHTLRAQYASLETLQQAALGKKGDNLQWMEKWQLANKPRLAENLQIESGWESAVEAVLGVYLEAICVNGDEPMDQILASFDNGNLVLFLQDNEQHEHQAVAGERLADKVISAAPEIMRLLEDVYIASDLVNALSLRPQLQQHQSVVTTDGIHLSRHWLRVVKDKGDGQQGVLEREQEMRDLKTNIEQQSADLAVTERALQQHQQQLHDVEAQLQQTQQQLNEHNSVLADVRARWQVHGDQLQSLKRRAEQLAQENDHLSERSDQAAKDLIAAQQNWQQAVDSMESDTEQRQQLLQQREQCRSQLSQIRESDQQHRDELHRLDVRVQTIQSQIHAAQEALSRTRKQRDDLLQRQERLKVELSQGFEPVEQLQQQLELLLAQRLQKDEILQTIKQQSSELDYQIQQLEDNRRVAETAVQEVRQALEGERLQLQEQKVRRTTLQESIDELQYQLAEILATIDETTDADQLDQQLQRVANSISRLGPINLAAIEELKTESERQAYLAKQRADLEDALQTLESAIRKIDQETKQRFRETFDKVNEEFQRLFPKIFGGGKAYLELTDDNLLETGVAVMAQPPGKKNSSIHLLSGGEKALTAIALIFSIFQLNPAPFCMLDEVDAPLDDANVLRYSNLVKEMSSKVQFIFVTHNKVTMEIAEQLTGVTMNEPGVSRIVAVDIEKAVEMTAA